MSRHGGESKRQAADDLQCVCGLLCCCSRAVLGLAHSHGFDRCFAAAKMQRLSQQRTCQDYFFTSECHSNAGIILALQQRAKGEYSNKPSQTTRGRRGVDGLVVTAVILWHCERHLRLPVVNTYFVYASSSALTDPLTLSRKPIFYYSRVIYLVGTLDLLGYSTTLSRIVGDLTRFEE